MEHHPDIQVAIDTLAHFVPLVAARASKTLGVLLRRANEFGARSEADHHLAWGFSTLTGDGFPLEIAFTTADAHLRYTVDPGGPDLPPAQRLANAAELLAELGRALQPHRLEELKTWQSAASAEELRYGAWVGVRHSVKSLSDRFKLYVEIPASVPLPKNLLVAAHLNPPLRLPERAVQLRMLGLDAETGQEEYYYRVNDLSSIMLPQLLVPAGLRARADELLNFVELAYGHSLREPDARIPGESVGFSYAVSPEGNPVAFTLFLFTHLIWGGDMHIRERFCERLQSAGLDSQPYWHITAPLAECDRYQTYHSLLGFVLAGDAPIHLSLGLRPVGFRSVGG
jgi:hypothetical protein